jgi:mycofactocin precursor
VAATSTVADSPGLVAEPDELTPAVEPGAPLLEELLVEEVSIDGMCGVY